MSSKIQNGINLYSEGPQPRTEDEIASNRSESRERQDKRSNRILTYAAVGILAAVGANAAYKYETVPPLRTVDARVKPGDHENPSLVAGRVELRYGVDQADYNLQNAALALAKKYPHLYPGELVQVQVR